MKSEVKKAFHVSETKSHFVVQIWIFLNQKSIPPAAIKLPDKINQDDLFSSDLSGFPAAAKISSCPLVQTLVGGWADRCPSPPHLYKNFASLLIHFSLHIYKTVITVICCMETMYYEAIEWRVPGGRHTMLR